MSEAQRIRITLRSFDHIKIDNATSEIVNSLKSSGALIKGPIPLPNSKESYTLLTSPHVDKDAREHFKITTHRRLIDIVQPHPDTVNALMKLNISSGVNVKISVENLA